MSVAHVTVKRVMAYALGMLITTKPAQMKAVPLTATFNLNNRLKLSSVVDNRVDRVTFTTVSA